MSHIVPLHLRSQHHRPNSPEAEAVYELHANAYAMNPNGYRKPPKHFDVPGGPLLAEKAAYMMSNAAFAEYLRTEQEDDKERKKARKDRVRFRTHHWHV